MRTARTGRTELSSPATRNPTFPSPPASLTARVTAPSHFLRRLHTVSLSRSE